MGDGKATHRGERIVGLDLLRSASILTVLVGHLLLSGQLRDGLGSNVLQKLSRPHYGVCIFFVVSGFIITETVLRRSGDAGHVSRRDFYARRIGRLLPLALVVLVGGSVLLASGLGGGGRPFVLESAGAHFDGWFFLSFPTFTFNLLRTYRFHPVSGWGVWWDVFWSLAIEEQFYLVYPFVIRRLGTGRRLMTLLIAVIVAGFAWAVLATRIDPGNDWLALLASPAGFGLIAMGCALAIALRHEWVALSARRSAISGITGVAVLVAVFTKGDLSSRGLVLAWGPYLVGIAAVLLIAAVLPLDRRPLLAAAALPGELSYGMYLLHPVTLLVLWPLIPHLPGGIAGFACFVLAVVAVAFASYRMFEQPTNRWLRARLRPWVAARETVATR